MDEAVKLGEARFGVLLTRWMPVLLCLCGLRRRFSFAGAAADTLQEQRVLERLRLHRGACEDATFSFGRVALGSFGTQLKCCLRQHILQSRRPPCAHKNMRFSKREEGGV